MTNLGQPDKYRGFKFTISRTEDSRGYVAKWVDPFPEGKRSGQTAVHPSRSAAELSMRKKIDAIYEEESSR